MMNYHNGATQRYKTGLIDFSLSLSSETNCSIEIYALIIHFTQYIAVYER